MIDHELICPRCHKTFSQHDEFCPEHGLPLVAKARVEATPTEAQPQAPGSITANDADTKQSAANGATSTGAQAHELPPGASPVQNHLGKLAKVLQLKGLKPHSARSTFSTDEAQPTPDSAQHSSHEAASESLSPSPLPQEVLAKSWVVRGLPVSYGGADHWPVQREGQLNPVKGVFCQLQSGSLTPPALYRRLLEASTVGQHRARLWQHGTTDRGHGVRADYELVSVAGDGMELSSWLQGTSPSEARALSLLPALLHLLQALQDEGAMPLVLEPGMLVRLENGDLCLSRLWALIEATADVAPPMQRYRPEFQRTLLLPVPWAAPELSASQVESGNAAVFSVGQLLACALWGQPATHQDLRTGALPFHSIHHAGLARLMQLCLWHLPQDRATTTQLLLALAEPQAVEQMPEAPAWAALMPGAAVHGFTLAGTRHWRLEDLLASAVLPSHWDEAAHKIEAIMEWASGTAWASTANILLEALRHGGRSPDWVLMQLVRRVRPQAPVTWRRLDLSDAQASASLTALAQGALAGKPDDMQLLQRLFQADLRGALLLEIIDSERH